VLSDNSLNDHQIAARQEASMALLEAIREAAVQSKNASGTSQSQGYAQSAKQLAEAFSTLYRDA
jgi:hypothetical protein